MHKNMSCAARTLLLLPLPSASIIYYPTLRNWERRAHTSPYICWHRIYESSFVVTAPVASVCAYFRVLRSTREEWRARQALESKNENHSSNSALCWRTLFVLLSLPFTSASIILLYITENDVHISASPSVRFYVDNYESYAYKCAEQRFITWRKALDSNNENNAL